MDFHLRQRADGRQIRLLSCWAGGVRCSGNPGGEILQPLDCVRAWNQLLNQLNRIEPTERRALNRPVVEVEAVDIDIGPNGFPPNSKGRSEKRPLSRQHAAGGYVAQSSGSSSNDASRVWAVGVKRKICVVQKALFSVWRMYHSRPSADRHRVGRWAIDRWAVHALVIMATAYRHPSSYRAIHLGKWCCSRITCASRLVALP